MIELQNVDLTTDPDAARYIKTELVTVHFARESGELQSLEGPNRYAAGDALVTGTTGSRWAVARARFEDKYQPLSGTGMWQDGRYAARPRPVLAKQMIEPFSVARSPGGDLLRGQAGDWLLQYAPGDFGVAAQGRFASVYRKVGEGGPL